MSSNNTATTMHLALVGDSDIARWPKDLWPFATENDFSPDRSFALHRPLQVSGVSGATLDEIRPLAQEALHSYTTTAIPTSKEYSDEIVLVLVLCAGENDLSTPNLSLDDTIDAFHTLVQEIQDHQQQHQQRSSSSSSSSSAAVVHHHHIHVIFLGPKIEPWLDYDTDARKDYLRLSQRLEQACSTLSLKSDAEQQSSSFSMEFVNCLLLFCEPDAAKQKGALWGGRAKAMREYFDHDELHLSREGYQIWKSVVEEAIQQFCKDYYQKR